MPISSPAPNELEALELTAVAWLRSIGYLVTKVDVVDVVAVPCSAPLPESVERRILLDSPKIDKTPVDFDAFDAFWFDYPRKENKAAARKAWRTAIKKRADVAIHTALIEQREAGVFAKDDPKYIPLASTWLNQERWDNPLPKQAPKPGVQRRSALEAFLAEAPFDPQEG